MSADCPCCGEARPSVRWGDLSVSPDTGATWEGRSIHLSRQRLMLLYLLARRAPNLVHRDTLFMGALNEDTDDKMLGVQLHHLRKALKSAGVPIAITATYGLGYRLEKTPDLRLSPFVTTRVASPVTTQFSASWPMGGCLLPRGGLQSTNPPD